MKNEDEVKKNFVVVEGRIRFAGWNSVRGSWNLVAEQGEIERIELEFSRKNEERKLLQNKEEEDWRSDWGTPTENDRARYLYGFRVC